MLDEPTYLSSSSSPQPSPSRNEPKSENKSQRKVIFASGGITTGAQALAVLEQGASVAQIYTALVYGGAGTVTRLKGEMRGEMIRRRLLLDRTPSQSSSSSSGGVGVGE